MRSSSSTPRRLALASIALSIALGIACSDSYETIVGFSPLTTRVVQDSAESIFGEPDDHFQEMEIDWPSETPAYLVPGSALADAVASAGGRVHIGFKEPTEKAIAAREKRAGPMGLRVDDAPLV